MRHRSYISDLRPRNRAHARHPPSVRRRNFVLECWWKAGVHHALESRWTPARGAPDGEEEAAIAEGSIGVEESEGWVLCAIGPQRCV